MKVRSCVWRGVLSLLLLLLGLAGASALINRTLPEQSTILDKLSEAEKARLAEFIQLRQQLGDTVWPGWQTAEIPIIVYNEAYVFLLGISEPPDGWQKVPQSETRGVAWEPVPHDLFAGEPYYRQPLSASGETPEAFTVKVGELWAASMPTMTWMEISLRNQFQADLPGVLAPIFPYPMVTDLFIRGSDGYISLLAHESFHAYQGMIAPERLAAAETAVSHHESAYPWPDLTFREAWQKELDLLAAAVRAKTDTESLALIKQYLAQREIRRKEAGLSPALVSYEKQREWLEGLARYVEVEIWHQASLADSYQPVPALLDDPDFSGYATFENRWSQEIDQTVRMANDEGDGRFYYSGMAQAVLLDRFSFNWKRQVLSEGAFLEDLLRIAVEAGN